MRFFQLTILLTLLALAVGALAGCAGGQTGEITRLGPCREDLGETDVAPLSAALDRLGRTPTVRITWQEASFAVGETELTAQLDEVGPAHRVGGEGCAEPLVSAHASVLARSADGAFDQAMYGTVASVGGERVVVRVSAAAADHAGTGRLPDEDGTLWLELLLQSDGVTGSVRFEPLLESRDETELALF